VTRIAALDARLAALKDAADVRAEVAAVLSEHWSAGREKAASKLASGLGGVEVARLFAAAADEMLQALWRFTTQVLHPSDSVDEDAKLALLATGGYGRGVLAPYSDLDLLFLRPARAGERIEHVTGFMLYVLWDLGAKVGVASRTMNEALTLARDDMTIQTSLLEARFLAGDEVMADAFLKVFRREMTKTDPRAFIAAKLKERDQRHSRAGAVRYRVEPNIKDGKGGLRDLNALFWIARRLTPDSLLGAEALEGLLTGRERRTFEESFDFLWRVRHHLHRAAGRAEEKLTFDLQPEVARRMGWQGRGDEPAVERFMRRYFLVARDVGGLTRAISAKLEERGQKRALSLTRLIPRRRRQLGEPGFVEDHGRLSITGPDVFEAEPRRLLTLFQLADRHDLDLHPDAFSAVTRSLNLVTPKLRRDPAASDAFLDILANGDRPYRVLTLMNETGLLGRFLPEWGRIVGQTQFNMYHAYTVDEHTLQAIGVINDIARGKLKDDHPMSSSIIGLIRDPQVLMLAMLLHDVGKGGDRGQLEDGAIAARRACERLGLDPRRAELVAWLVRQHLTLSDYAQKRDVSDPATVRAFAEIVGDLERLRMLLVLTVADIRAVGPGVWNGWKGQLMRDLYRHTERQFRGDAAEMDDPLSRPMAAYDALVERARRDGAAAMAGPSDNQAAEVAIAASDRPGLFALIAGVMADLGADIVGARVTTAADGTALDIFQLQDGAGEPYGLAEPRRLRRLLAALERVGRGGAVTPADPAAPASPRRAAFDVRPVVMIDYAASETATVIEVSGANRPRLLAQLSRALADLGLSIRSAHVVTFGERAADSFYVTTDKGQKITGDRRLDAIRSALEAVMDQAPPPSPRGRPLIRARASARDVSELGRKAAVPRGAEAR
jgi:[protein-PII] uridylyltransferase